MATDAGDDGCSDSIEFNAVPSLDLRMLSRSDLQALSVSSNSCLNDLSRLYEEITVPEIDRAVFNESAGSRKQTYSRFRLAPRNNSKPTNRTRHEHAASTSADDRIRDEENRRVTEALKELFSEPIDDLGPNQNASSESLPTSASD